MSDFRPWSQVPSQEHSTSRTQQLAIPSSASGSEYESPWVSISAEGAFRRPHLNNIKNSVSDGCILKMKHSQNDREHWTYNILPFGFYPVLPALAVSSYLDAVNFIK